MRAIIILLILSTAAYGQPLPLPKVGGCPGGYIDNRHYCVPVNDQAPVAIPKTGFRDTGHYCVDARVRR
jgi:hypothetical protein